MYFVVHSVFVYLLARDVLMVWVGYRGLLRLLLLLLAVILMAWGVRMVGRRLCLVGGV